ncbi:MAG: hypothetical protein MZU97_08150 [Bacillus subtilis]|nr:hypothetical protein [Bacillus subtilis]
MTAWDALQAARGRELRLRRRREHDHGRGRGPLGLHLPIHPGHADRLDERHRDRGLLHGHARKRSPGHRPVRDHLLRLLQPGHEHRRHGTRGDGFLRL